MPEARKQGDDPIAAAIDVINKLLALCTKHGLKRDAYSIVIGREIPKRSPGRPRQKTGEYRRSLAAMLDIESRANGRFASRARLARLLAESTAEEKKHSAAWRSEEAAQTIQFQNDLASLKPEEVLEAAYYVRRIEAGETLDAAKARLDAMIAGDDEAERETVETIRDVLSEVHRKSRR